MNQNRKSKSSFLKLKMFLFKLNYIFIYIAFRPKKIFINKDSKKKFKKTKTPLIYTYNHVGYYDGLTLWAAFITRSIRFIALKEIAKNKISTFFFNWNGLILIDRDVFLLNDFRMIRGAIKDGYSVAMAPEGHINKKIKLKPYQIGSAKFALKTKTDVLPIYFVPNQKMFFQRQRIYIGDIINIKDYNDSEELTKEIVKKTEELRYNAFFNNKSYVFTLPVDRNIKDEDVKLDFYKKYSSNTHQYHSSKSAWYYLDKILETRFGITIKKEDILFKENEKPIHKDICFNISHDGDLVAIIISKDECSIDIEKGATKEIKEWTKKEALIKFDSDLIYKEKTKRIKFKKDKYYLSLIAKGKISYNNVI